jgi:hypothetical protein
MNMANQPNSRYSRADLPMLKSLDRSGVYAALGSFDSAGLSDDAFVTRALMLLDPARVPGLGGPQPLEALLKACGRPFTEKGEADESVLRTAEDALKNRFTFYGEAHTLPASIDWDFNPGTAHWGHDLNRFNYLTPLVRAYFKTGDTRFSRKAADLILDWIAKCDFARAFAGTKYAFGSYLNNAIHAQAWGWTISRLAAAGQVTPLELLRVAKSLQEHLAYLEIVTNGHQGNWPTIGCMGMLATLEELPVLKDTDRFADYCRSNLATQVAEQVLPDGVQDELTPHYHQVVINNLCTCPTAASRWPLTTAILRPRPGWRSSWARWGSGIICCPRTSWARRCFLMRVWPFCGSGRTRAICTWRSTRVRSGGHISTRTSWASGSSRMGAASWSIRAGICTTSRPTPTAPT